MVRVCAGVVLVEGGGWIRPHLSIHGYRLAGDRGAGLEVRATCQTKIKKVTYLSNISAGDAYEGGKLQVGSILVTRL